MTYHAEKDSDNIARVREQLLLLPAFVREFDTNLSNRNLSTRTRLGYMYDLVMFFDYLTHLNKFQGKKPLDFIVQDLDEVTRLDVEGYLAKFDLSPQGEANKGDKLKARRLASLRSFYNYYTKGGVIRTNPAAITATPKLSKKEVVSLTQEEVARLLTCVETGEGLPPRQRAFAQKTRLRDKAILITLLGTGIRVSECVGLDLSNVNFYDASFQVIRKGGDEDTVYFGDEVQYALEDYIDNERDLLKPETSALFVSSTHGRLTDRAIENLVVKYTQAAGITKHITPHKCRSTFATNLYDETNDVYMIKDALHHKSLETSKHYINGAEMRKRKASRVGDTLFEGFREESKQQSTGVTDE